MQLDQYISDLLYRYECVILPEFGAFLTQLQSAQVHSSTNAFYPPKKRLSFNSQLTDNDGLLANYISKTEMISYEESNVKIASYVRYLYDGLQKGESKLLKNIGSLSLDEDNKLQFEPSYHLNYLTSSFGLSSFTSSQVLREVYKEETTAIETTTPIAFIPERRSNSNWIKYAAAAVVVLGVSGILGYTYLRDVEEFNYASKQEANLQLEDKIQEATFIIKNPLPAITLAVSKPTGTYHIVAGAFRQEENAATRVSQLREKGYKARQIGANRYGLYQVVYGSYTNSDEAIKILRKIRKEDNVSAWLLVQKLK